MGAVWSEPFLGLLLVGGNAAIIDQRIVNWDCAVDISYYAKYIFFMLLPWATVVVTAIIYSLIFLFRVVIGPRLPKWRGKYTEGIFEFSKNFLLYIYKIIIIFFLFF